MSGSFDTGRLIEDCRAALADPEPAHAARELVQRAVAEPSSVARVLGGQHGGVSVLHRADDLTVLNVQWAPRMTLRPHDHHMWAVIGVYTGREDNIFWRRISEEPERIEAAGARSLGAGDVTPLGRDIIHSVTNPLARITGAIHVYGGDFFAQERSEWDPETLRERAYDVDANMRLFAEFETSRGR